MAPPEDPALVVFTSGTTGAPRAVVHTRRSLGAALAAARTAIPLAPQDVVLTDQLMIGLAAIAAGAGWDVPRIGAHPDDLVRRIRAGRPSHVFTTPVVWHQVLLRQLRSRTPGSMLPPSLRFLLTGGAPAPAALLSRLADAAPQGRVLSLYGGTELLPAAVVEARRKAAFTGDGDLVGRLLPGVRARIDPGSGEVFLAAPQLCAGYLRPDGVAPLAEFATGDAGRLEPGPDGVELVLAGRLKDMLIRGSTNIYPALFEPGVLAVPGVADCALVGLPDPDTADERAVLAVVAGPGHAPGAVLAAVRAALPRIFDADALPDEVVTVAALPRSGRSEKLDRPALVRQLADRGTR